MPLAAVQSTGWCWSYFLAGPGGPTGDEFGAWCRASSGEWQRSWLIISHWGGADAVPVVTSGGRGKSRTQWNCGESLADQSALAVLICGGV